MELTIPFVARGTAGQVFIHYSRNDDPDRWSFDILGLQGDYARAAAFPVFEASVTYAREGYAAIFGWIQVIRYWSAEAAARPRMLVDVAPQMRGLGLPFISYGVRPTCFDAPLDTPEDCSRWEALTFLTQTPDGLMTREIVPLLGVKWGYLVDADSPDAPTLIPPVEGLETDWLDARSHLEQELPAWRFSAGLPSTREQRSERL